MMGACDICNAQNVEIVRGYVSGIETFYCANGCCAKCGGNVPAHSCTQPDCPCPALASAHGLQPPAAPSRVAPSDANSGQQSEAGAAFDSIVNARL